jgi:hypothetical protein
VVCVCVCVCVHVCLCAFSNSIAPTVLMSYSLPTLWYPLCPTKSLFFPICGVSVPNKVFLLYVLWCPLAQRWAYMARCCCSAPSHQNLWVEWANEPWHTGFEGGKYAQIQGIALGLNESGAAWYGGAINEARLCYVGNRTAAISVVWKAVFGARVKVRVSGGGGERWTRGGTFALHFQLRSLA